MIDDVYEFKTLVLPLIIKYRDIDALNFFVNYKNSSSLNIVGTGGLHEAYQFLKWAIKEKWLHGSKAFLSTAFNALHITF